MLTAQASALLERVQALTLRDVVVAVACITLGGAIAWIGWSVSRLLDNLDAEREHVRRLEARQDRLQQLVERNWRDSRLMTEPRDSGFTRIDLSKP